MHKKDTKCEGLGETREGGEMSSASPPGQEGRGNKPRAISDGNWKERKKQRDGVRATVKRAMKEPRPARARTSIDVRRLSRLLSDSSATKEAQ